MAISLWKPDHLIAQLAAGRLVGRGALAYLTIAVTQALALYAMALGYGPGSGWAPLLAFGAAAVVTAIGIGECFHVNGGAKGRHFVERLYALSVPLNLKWVVVIGLVALLYRQVDDLLFHPALFRNPGHSKQIAWFVIGVGFIGWFWWRLIDGMERVHDLETRSNRDEDDEDFEDDDDTGDDDQSGDAEYDDADESDDEGGHEGGFDAGRDDSDKARKRDPVAEGTGGRRV